MLMFQPVWVPVYLQMLHLAAACSPLPPAQCRRGSCWLLPPPTTLYLRYQTQRTLQRGLDRADHRYELPGAPTPAMPDLGDQKKKTKKTTKSYWTIFNYL